MASTSTNSTLTVGTLVVPVALKKISDKKEVAIGRAINGHKIARKEIDSVTGEVVTPDAIQRGVWENDTVFKEIAADAIEAIEEATKLDEFAINTFIPYAAIPWERGSETYFLAPQKGKGGPQSARAMKLLQKALLKSKRAGVMKVCLTKRQYLAVLHAKGKRLYVTILAWSEDWTQASEADDALAGITVEAAHVDMAVQLIEALSTDDVEAALNTPTDSLRAERAKLIEDALAGKAVKPRGKKAAPKADDSLMAALEASLVAAK